jgi:hypothetical protein
MDQPVSLWVVIALPFAGYLAAAATEYLRGRQALIREREARAEERFAARQDTRDAFERTTLLEFQDAIAALMRNMARVHHESEMEYRRSGTWGREKLSEEIGGEPSIQLVRNFQRLRVRLLDDALRKKSTEWLEVSSPTTLGAMRDEEDVIARQRADTALAHSASLYKELTEAIGERLRFLIAYKDDR